MRLFVALPVPTAVEHEIAQLQTQLAGRLPDLPISWQAVERAHITLVFLGTVDERDVPYCRQALAAAARRHPPFTLTSTVLGAFPSRRRPSVLWLGVGAGEGVDGLAALQRDLARRLSVLRRGAETQTFRPHLTLGRLRLGVGDVGPLSEALATLEPQPHSWAAEEVVLYRSRNARGGVVYSALANERLGPGSDGAGAG